MKLAFVALAVATAAFVTPASAAMMACTGENMAKAQAASEKMPYTRGRMMMDKEIAAANTNMSKGNMRGACSNFMRAQRMSAMK